MTLMHLPDEILCCIASFLTNDEIQSLAQTFNTKITSICLTILHEWLCALRNERKMVTIFGKPTINSDNQLACLLLYRESEPEDIDGPSTTPHIEAIGAQLRLFEFLQLNGDLRWIQTLDPNMISKISVVQDQPAATVEQMATLEGICQELGFTLPKGYADFMTSLERQRCFIPGSWPWQGRFICGPMSTVICERPTGASPSKVVGFMHMFYDEGRLLWSNQGPPKHFYLYLDHEGGHCILRGAYDSRALVRGYPNDKGDMILSEIALSELRGNLYLEGTCFEAFLARKFFEEWAQCWAESAPYQPIPFQLKEYLFRVYTEDGRALEM